MKSKKWGLAERSLLSACCSLMLFCGSAMAQSTRSLVNNGVNLYDKEKYVELRSRVQERKRKIAG